jgi:hypothetical protein
MPRYDELTTTAFHLQPDGLYSLGGRHWVLSFPRGWLAPITELEQTVSGRRRSPSIAALNRGLRSLVPDISAVRRGVGKREHPGDWLYATSPVPVDGLAPIIHARLRTIGGSDGAIRGSQLWQQLPKGDLTWRPLGPDELGWPGATSAEVPDSEAATAAIAGLPRALFYLVPEILIAELLRRSDRPDGFPRGFRRCPTGDGRGVELMTWPPLESTDQRGHAWPFSYRVRLTMQTIPFQPHPVVHVTVGMRRWCRRAPSTGRGRSVSAYLLCSVPWIAGLPASRSFRMAPMRWRRADDVWALQWKNELAYLFDQISFERPLPDPAILGHDPLPFLTEEGIADSGAAIVYTTSAGYSHRVGAGVSARDRDCIVSWIGKTLTDLITPAPALPRVPVTTGQTDKAAPAAVRERLREVLDKRALAVEVYWDTEAVRNALLQAVMDDLGLDPADGALDGSTTRWNTTELAVVMRTTPVGALGAALQPDPGIKDLQIRASRAAQPRIDMLREALGQAPSPAVSLIELRGREAFPQPGSDPKTALRVGFAACGRLTQFVKPEPGQNANEEERLSAQSAVGASLPHKVMPTWLDLRRQLVGVIQPPHPRVKGLAIPEPVDTVAIFMIRRNATDQSWAGRHQLPIAIWTSSDDTAVWARTLGMDEWQPYHRALLDLAGRAFKLPNCGQRPTMSFIRSVITSVQADRPVLLLTWVQNLRFDWPDIQNSELTIDQVTLDGDPIGSSAPQLRHVRIRTNNDDETPQCYGLRDQGVGLPAGLWRLPGTERTFASTGGKPGSAKSHGSPMGSRIQIRLNKNGRAVLEDQKEAWNPQLVEFTVASMPPGDDPAVWAALAHAQRRIGETYTDTLTFPLAFHLARKAAEYAIPSSGEDVTTADEAGASDDAIPDQDLDDNEGQDEDR